MIFNIFTDGGARRSGISAWAFAVYDEDSKLITQSSGALEDITNQQAEMLAVIKAFEYMHEIGDDNTEMYVHSDSAYVVNCIENEWWKKWIDNGWKTAKGHGVKNSDLWKTLLYYALLFEASFVKVKGHSDNEQNNYVDKLVNEAMDSYREEL